MSTTLCDAYVETRSAQQATGSIRSLANNCAKSKAIATDCYDRGRAPATKLVGSSAQSIAYVQNTSHGLSLVALGVDWQAGDNLVVCAEDIPSNYLCWVQLAERGVEIRRVSALDGRLRDGHFSASDDERTRVVAVSHVQFHSGFRVDLAALGDICTKSSALLVVDGTQSIGAISLDVSTTGTDVLVVSAHKWLLGPRGIGFASFSERALNRVTPAIVGWMSVNDPFAFNRTLDYLPDALDTVSQAQLADQPIQIQDAGLDPFDTQLVDPANRSVRPKMPVPLGCPNS